MKVLGLIPARGGSKTIPRKNIALLNGKPLLAYTCEAALQSKFFDRVILSTDDKEITAVGKKFGVEVPFLRPPELARDESGMREVILHALNFLERSDQYVPDIVVLLQPTSPLRIARHIDAAVELLQKSGADCVVSVTEVPHQFTPTSLMKLENKRLQSYQEGGPCFYETLRRQDKPKMYSRNGPAVLVLRRSSFLKHQNFYAGDVRPLIMPSEESIDIDTPFDFALAEYFLQRKHHDLKRFRKTHS